MKRYRTFIVLIVMAAFCFLAYFYVQTKDGTETSKTVKEESELSKLLNRDMDTNYPETPKEVVKLYSRFLVQFYNENLTEEELDILAQKSQKLMDTELLEKNPYDRYIQNLKEDIEKNDSEGRTISNYIVGNSYEVEYKTFQERYYAKLKCVYYCKSKSGTEKTLQEYTLRKDDKGRWKLLFWNLAQESEDE